MLPITNSFDASRRTVPGWVHGMIRGMARLLVACGGFAVGAGLVSAETPASTKSPSPARVVDFRTEVEPILTRHCLDCHGPEKHKSGYRLDARSLAVRGGDSGNPGFVPGDAAHSPLIRLVTTSDDTERMPPKGERLTAPEVETLKLWIDQGAVWPESAGAVVEDPRDWWSLRPLQRPAVPAVAGVGHPVDAFIQAAWRSTTNASSTPRVGAPEADRRTLIRRVTFDLTGLPPTPEEVAAFVGSKDPRAYEALVDRLLASPRYGERWARHWLDVVHYGDTHGYDKDKLRPNAWPYRDYVIRSFNEDKPYRRFVEEQLAGDVLFPDTADGIEALGFLSAGPWDFIGHEELPETKIDGKIARHLDRDDMVSNTIGTFASLTVHCAQCHNHKFDPIPMSDYYALQAVFAAVDRTERRYYRDPELNHRRAAIESRLRSAARGEKEFKEALTNAGGEALKEMDRRIGQAEEAAKSGQPAEYGWHSGIADREDAVKWVQVDLGRTVTIDRVVLAPCRDDFNQIGDGFGYPPRFRIELADDPEFKGPVVVVADRTRADEPKPGIARQTFAAGGGQGRHVRVTATRLAPRQNDFIFALAELEVFDAGGTNVARGATVTSLDSIEAPARWARQNLTDGRAPGAVPTSQEIERLRAAREEWVASTVPEAIRRGLAEARQAKGEAQAELDALPKPLTAYVGAVHYGSGNFRGTGPDEGRPRPIHLLPRGDVRKPGALAEPGALGCVSGLASRFAGAAEASEGARRAALARWLVDPVNPLTWRSVANRIWQRRFGLGLVETPNDFGRMGGRPTHPELLDWLAVEFREGGQSFKALDRLLVTSATYRQSGVAADERGGADAGGVVDTDNRWWARRTARRLDAEAVRDSLLAVAGKLDLTMYGPGFQDFVIEKPEHSPHYEYQLYDPEDGRSHRRSIYRFLVRSQQEPFMTALDCADPSMRVDRRNETLTPLQALALLNSRLVVVMARHFAARVEKEAGAEVEAQVERAFALAVQRAPGAEERDDLAGYVRKHGLSAGCRLLLNLNEFVFVD